MDDATGTVVNALGRPEGDTRGYFLLMEGVIRSYGIPLDIYGDRHGVFKFNGKHRHITQPVGPTQFTRAIGELGIERTDLCPFAPGREDGLDVGLPGGVQKPADDRIGGATTRAAFQPSGWSRITRAAILVSRRTFPDAKSFLVPRPRYPVPWGVRCRWAARTC